VENIIKVKERIDFYGHTSDKTKEWNRPMKKFSFWGNIICMFKGHTWGWVSVIQSLPRLGCQICQRCGSLGDYVVPTKEQLKDCWNE
jgi:hypothetical protein